MKGKIIFLVFLAVGLVFTLVGASCQKESSTTNQSSTQTETKAKKAEKTYSLGQAFIAGSNLQFRVDKVEKKEVIKYEHCSKIMGDECNDFIPEKGVYLVVYLTFKGNAGNEFGGYDTDAVKLVDSQDNSYNNIEPNGAIDEWRMQSGVPNFSFAMINSPEEKQYMEIYDIPKEAKGLKLQWLARKDQKIIAEAEVDLGI